jgi:hypothetical protein
MHITPTPRAHRIRQRELRWTAGILGVFLVATLAIATYIYGPSSYAAATYQPQEGDVVFQSLPHSPLVNAIEGGSGSPLSHCGIVAREGNRWVVYEALRPVGPTRLSHYLARGRNRAFLVKRLRPEHQTYIPAMLTSVREMRGKPYDIRYRLDDNRAAIYCSELIYLAWQDATAGQSSAQPLGKLITLGELKWKPYEQLIEHLEKAPPPLDRQMITPRDLSQAKQFETALSFGY